MTAVRIVRETPGGFDAYGDPAEGAEVLIDVPGAYVYPRRRAAELGPVDGRASAGVIDGLTVIMPAGTDLRVGDDVEVGGVRFRVDGQPGVWTNPWTGWQAGIECALVRAEGV